MQHLLLHVHLHLVVCAVLQRELEVCRQALGDFAKLLRNTPLRGPPEPPAQAQMEQRSTQTETHSPAALPDFDDLP